MDYSRNINYLFIYVYLISLLLNQGFSYFNANYNLKTRYTVIPLYNVDNIPKLIFFDTAQRYEHLYTFYANCAAIV